MSPYIRYATGDIDADELIADIRLMHDYHKSRRKARLILTLVALALGATAAIVTASTDIRIGQIAQSRMSAGGWQ